MAMRLFTEAEFEEHLKERLGLTPTDERTETTRFWKAASGHVVSVPVLDAGEKYPDYLLDEIYEQLRALEESF